MVLSLYPGSGAAAVLALCLVAESLGDAPAPSHAIVTFATNDVYALAATVLGRTLAAEDTGAAGLVALVLSDVSRPARILLAEAGWDVREVAPVAPPAGHRSTWVLGPGDRDLNVEYGKLRAWELGPRGGAEAGLGPRPGSDLDRFDRVMLVDADNVAKGSLKHLFDDRFFRGSVTGRYERASVILSGALLLFRPNATFASELLRWAQAKGGHGGMALQGLLNDFLASEWKAKGDDERVSTADQYGAAACTLAGATAASVAAALRRAPLIDFQGVTKPWRWPPTTGVPQCEVLTAYAKAWGCVLAAPPGTAAETIRSVFANVDEDPGHADGLLAFTRAQVRRAILQDADLPLQARGPGAADASDGGEGLEGLRARYAFLAPHLPFGLGNAVREALGEVGEVRDEL